MAAHSTNIHAAPHFPGKGFTGFFASIGRALTAARLASELNSMSDRELADLGLGRADLRKVVLDALDGKAA